MDKDTEPGPVRPITELMREQDREIERMIDRDRRLLVLLAVFVVGLFAAGAALWMS